MLQLMGIAFLFGAFMGFVFHVLRNNKTIVTPKKVKNGYHVGFLIDLITGGIGAVVLILISLNGQDLELWRIVLLSIIGASAGESFLMRLDAKRDKYAKKLLQDVDKDLDEEL